jgi:hypothetical protein
MVLDRGIALVKPPELRIIGLVLAGWPGTHDLCFRTFPAAISSCRLSRVMMRGWCSCLSLFSVAYWRKMMQGLRCVCLVCPVPAKTIPKLETFLPSSLPYLPWLSVIHVQHIKCIM